MPPGPAIRVAERGVLGVTPGDGLAALPPTDGARPGGSSVHGSVVGHAGRSTDHRHTEKTGEQIGAGMGGARIFEPQPGPTSVVAFDREAKMLPSVWNSSTASVETGAAADGGADDPAMRGLAMPPVSEAQAAPTSLGTHMVRNSATIDGEPFPAPRGREATPPGLLRRLVAEPAVSWAPAWPRVGRVYLPPPTETPIANGERP